MKQLKTTFLTLACLLMTVVSVQAQNDALQREINIAESILNEIFTSDDQPDFPLFGDRLGHITTDYIPGYGVHFSVGENISASSIRVSGTIRVESNSARDQNGEDRSVTADAVEEKILEYITDYASAIQNLPDDESVRISYGLRSGANRVISVLTNLEEYTADIPKMTFVVNGDDLKRHREGRISDDQLISRVQKTDLSDIEEKRDLNIFASVLESSLNSAGTEHLRVNQKPHYEYLPGLGVHYQVNVSMKSSFNFSGLMDWAREIDSLDFDDVDIQIDFGDLSSERNSDGTFIFNMPDSGRFEFNMDSLNFNSEQFNERIDEIRQHSDEMRKRGEQVRSEIEIRMNQQNSVDLTEDVDKIKSVIAESIRDYGSTLKSLQNGELLRITLNWRGQNDTMPEQTKIRISKSDLMNGNDPVMEDLSRR
ncbi:hypothetical protein [Rhodohalobacter sp.]|uniref:hypothetical protein n=1 Tax=Rhodohalobacter sp. TaxID=1974210 RepID=UPI002ACDBF5C|nr:hypothetical protein [Rhodohalobacter sp.]MDZ7754811.1 hypothetical protein [Rhodohalobacter sp.]